MSEHLKGQENNIPEQGPTSEESYEEAMQHVKEALDLEREKSSQEQGTSHAPETKSTQPEKEREEKVSSGEPARTAPAGETVAGKGVEPPKAEPPKKEEMPKEAGPKTFWGKIGAGAGIFGGFIVSLGLLGVLGTLEIIKKLLGIKEGKKD